MKDLVLNTISIDNKVVSVDDFISHNEYSLDKWYCFADFVLIRFNNVVLVRDLLSLKQKLVEYNEIYVKVLSACNYYTSVFGKKFKSVTEISKFIGLDNYDDETSLISYNMNPTTYWNSDAISAFKNKINVYLSEVDYN